MKGCCFTAQNGVRHGKRLIAAEVNFVTIAVNFGQGISVLSELRKAQAQGVAGGSDTATGYRFQAPTQRVEFGKAVWRRIVLNVVICSCAQCHFNFAIGG